MEYNNITDMYILCGGGLSAVFFNLGIIYSLYQTNQLFDKNNKFNKNLKFQCVSGACIPTLLLNYVVLNNFQREKGWFEKYILNPINKLNAFNLLQLYTTNTFKSYLLYSKSDARLIHLFDRYLIDLLKNIVPIEIQNGRRIIFSQNIQFDYIYILDDTINYPSYTADLSFLDNISVNRQIIEIIQRCTIFTNVSTLQTGFTNDPGAEINNIVIDIEKYNGLKRLYFSTLYNYNEITNQVMYAPFSPSYYLTRLQMIREYQNVLYLRKYCKTRNILFTEYAMPNKFNPVCTFDNKLYNELVPYIFLTDDYNIVERFTGFFLNTSGNKILYILFLFGAFESTNVVNIVYKKKYTEKDLRFNDFYKDIIKNCVKIWFPLAF